MSMEKKVELRNETKHLVVRVYIRDSYRFRLKLKLN